MRLKTVAKSILLMTACFTLTACVSPQQRYAQDYTVAKKNFAQQNYHSAFNRIQSPAKAGNPDAQYALGYMYYNGLGTIANHQLAAYWFQKAATKDQPAAKKALRDMQRANNQS